MIYNYIIIGAGLSGLTTAKILTENQTDNQNKDILVLDKSRGVGGRMATRRTLETKFDHGAQFYRLTEDSKAFHDEWLAEGLSHKWFENEKGEHWSALHGMTALPKFIAKNLSVELEKEISDIQFENDHWVIKSLKGEKWQTENLILSAPLPQTLKLIKTITTAKLVNLETLNQLEQIAYTKALIALITIENEFSISDSGHCEFTNSDFFSITDMQKKGISPIAAFTITMSAEFSEIHFEANENATLDLIQQKLKENFPLLKIKNAELKKWRYCMPLQRHTHYFEEIAPRLFLIGDSFGGSSLLGAIRSGYALAQFILKRNLT